MADPTRSRFDLSAKRKALLEAMLADRGAAAPSARGPAIPRRQDEGPAPLSFAQQRLWFIDQFQPNSALYNIPVTLRLAALDLDTLQRAVDEIVRRHAVLRTRFVVVDGVPMQDVQPQIAVPIELSDLRTSSPDEQRRAIPALVAAETQRPFDLANGPHLRLRVVRLADADHLLIIALHHLIADGWSVGILLRELSALYDAYAADRPSPLAELPLQYVDYAVWQRDWLSGALLDEHLTYWKRQLEGAPASLEWPSDRPRPVVQTFRGGMKLLEIPASVADRLQTLANSEGATLFMTLLAAFACLLQRYSRQDDVVIGSPIASRSLPEIEGLLGPFANTLALRVDLSGGPTFRTLLRRVKETTLAAYAHQDLPFERIVEELRPERNLSYAPIFQTLFILQNTPIGGVPGTASAAATHDTARPRSTPDLSLPIEQHGGTAKFDVTISLAQTPQGLSGMLEYATDLFDEATASRMIEHFKVLTAGVADDPDRPIWLLPILTETERRQVLFECNRTAAPYAGLCLHQMFEAQAARTPNAVALELGDETLTYRQLNERANQLAHLLRNLGVTRQDRVGICVERSFEMVIALLGVLKAGGVHTPLDPGYPKERLAYMCEDVGLRIVLTLAHMRQLLPPIDGDTILLDTEADRLAAQSTDNPINVTDLDDLAYVIFTSGSTGRPKGVAMAHRAMANLFAWQAPTFRSNDRVRAVQFTSFSFDVSVQEILSTLVTDGILVLMPEALRRDFREMLRFIAEKRIERLYLTFTALHLLAVAASELDVYPTTLTDIISTGEQMHLTRPVIDFMARLDGCVLHNQYGPTETHFATAYPLTGDPEAWAILPSIGRPIANTRIYLLDAHGQPVPIGVPGEVHIGGVMVAREYFNHPELTAKKFFADPFKPELFPGEGRARLYQTGDLARRHADGSLEYLGRMDFQVKLRGFRIELGEIEAALIQYPSVRDAVVVLREDVPGDQRLVAYLACDGEEPQLRDLRAFLAQRLPEYMVPSAIVVMAALPTSPNGKVDRRVLRAPEWERPALMQAYQAPRNEMERQLAGLMAQVLSVPSVGVFDNFFELGGHSLLATQLVSRVRSLMGLELSLRRIFETPTVAELATALLADQVRAADQAEILAAVEALSDEDARGLLNR